MKRLILSILISFLVLFVFAQNTPVKVVRIKNATTAFGSNLSIGDQVYNIANGDLWVAKTGVIGTATLTTASASFNRVNDGGVSGVTSTTTDQLSVANGTSSPALSIITGAVANNATSLATGGQIYNFVTGQGYLSSETDPSVKAVNGIVKSNGTTLSAAVAGDFPILNQNTTGNANSATIATNLANGSVGSIPYQSNTGTTAMLANGTTGQVLTANTGAAPSWKPATTGTVTAVSVVSANGITGSSSGGATPALTLSLGAITPASVAATTTVSGTQLISTNTTGQPFVVYSTTPVTNLNIGGNAATATTATNLSGGQGGQIAYQTASNTTAFSQSGTRGQVLAGNDSYAPIWIAAGTSGQVLVSNGATTLPSWGAPANLAGGSIGSIPYQSAAGTTTMLANGTTGQVLTANTGAAPSWTTLTTGTVTGVTGTLPIVSSGGTAPAISINAATTSAAGSMSAADKTKLDGIAAGAQVNVATNIGQGTLTTTTVPITSSTGTGTTLPAATTSLAGVMSATDKTKLDAITGTNTGNVTIGTANGLSLAGQALSMGLASTTTAGALSSTDWNTFNSKSSTNGTVTSVAMTVPTGLTVTGGPVTGSGTLALAFTSGYSIPTTTDQTNWNTAYTDRLKWDGGSTGLVAATGRTSLGATTVGSNVFTSTNPTAISFLRANADNTVSWLDAATFRTAIGAGTSSTNGTVTGVTGTLPIVSSGGTAPAISINAATTSAAGSMSAADKTKLDGIAAGAQVNVATNIGQGTLTTTTVPLTSSTGTGTTLPSATTSLAGVMSSADKTKLDGIAAGANNYTHPTGDGNLHVPANGTTYNGRVLTAGATAGSLSWTIPASGTVTSASVVTANGISGTVATANTTPAITLSLGAITPTSVASTGPVSGSDNNGGGTGVSGSSLDGIGVSGYSDGSNTGNAVGVEGSATSGIAIKAIATDGISLWVDVLGNSEPLHIGGLKTGTVTDDILTVESGGLVKKIPLSTISGGHTLDSHSNVSITANSAGEILKWNGSAWINNTLTEAGIQPAGSYLTANQSISFAPAAGDVTGTTSGTTSLAPVLTIGNNKVTYAKMQTVTAGRLLGNSSASAANPSEISIGSGLSLSGGTLSSTATGTVTGVSVAPANGITGSSSGGATPALTLTLGAITPSSVAAAGVVSGTQLTSTVATGTAPLVVTSTTAVPNLSIGGNAATATTATNFSGSLSGDVTGTQGATTIGANKVTYAKMQTVTAGRLLGNSSASVANPSEISIGSGLSLSGGTLSSTATGTVTGVSVAPANGITGSSSGGATPALTLTLGAITPSSVAATGAVSGTQLTSTVATGTAPLVVTSTTPVANLSIGGNAATATTAAATTVSNGTLLTGKRYFAFTTGNTGNQTIYTSTNLFFDDTGVTANLFKGDLSGNAYTATYADRLKNTTNDDGATPLYISLFSNYYGNGSYSFVSSKLSFIPLTGVLTAGGFVKTGGTSSQFLKADGSVDATSYLVREVADEFTATAGQTAFTLTQTPSTKSIVKMYINGIRISKDAVGNSGTTLTYNPASNGAYTLVAGDRIQLDYYY